MAKRNLSAARCFVEPLLAITQDLIYDVLKQVVEANAAFIENLNRAQLFAGKNADGSDITPDYTPVTEFIKRGKGQKTDVVTLRDTGAFYESVFVDVFEKAFAIDADDPKTAEIREKYGKQIFGLLPESKNKLIAVIKPQFVAIIKQRVK